MSVYFYGCVTLDGYLADKNHGLAWLHETGSAEDVGYEDFYRRMSVTLMGRRTFREIEAMGDPAAVYPTTRNYVFTHQAAPLPSGFTPVSGDVADFVKTFPPKKTCGSSAEIPFWPLFWIRAWWITSSSSSPPSSWAPGSLCSPKGSTSTASVWTKPSNTAPLRSSTTQSRRPSPFSHTKRAPLYQYSRALLSFSFLTPPDPAAPETYGRWASTLPSGTEPPP